MKALYESPLWLREPSSMPAKEEVNHPDHYGGDTTYETIKVLEAWLTSEQFIGFCRGNAIKYLSRAGKKSGADKIKDLEKARWYEEREVAYHKIMEVSS